MLMISERLHAPTKQVIESWKSCVVCRSYCADICVLVLSMNIFRSAIALVPGALNKLGE